MSRCCARRCGSGYPVVEGCVFVACVGGERGGCESKSGVFALGVGVGSGFGHF